jgi:hypothetical protein
MYVESESDELIGASITQASIRTSFTKQYCLASTVYRICFFLEIDNRKSQIALASDLDSLDSRSENVMSIDVVTLITCSVILIYKIN